MSDKSRKVQSAINDEQVLKNDLGMSTAPPDSPAGIPAPAESDFQVYIPSQLDGPDICNQHISVLALSNGDFFATWTQGALEGGSNQHIVSARSSDEGKTWTAAAYFDGPEMDGFIASWSFPFAVAATGRIYMFYNKHQGHIDFHHQWTGQLWFRYSDDNGISWSRAYKHLKISPDNFSHKDPDSDPNWIVYQRPIITAAGDVLAGFTQVATKAVARDDVFPSEVRFIRFDNILTEEDPENLRITTLPENGGDGLRMTDPNNTWASFLQEPSIQCLSDGRIFCVMRSATSFAAYSVSADNGVSWSKPAKLRYHEGGAGIRQPVVPCPLYKLSDGRFVLIFHNNSGDANQGRGVFDWCRNRRPVYLTVGTEKLDAESQPIVFDKPVLLADNDRIPISRKQLTEIGTYPSLFEHGGKIYFFFPDRKHYLLGKILTTDFIEERR